MSLALAVDNTIDIPERRRVSSTEDRLRDAVAWAVHDYVVGRDLSCNEFRRRYARNSRVHKAIREKDSAYMRLSSWLLLAEEMGVIPAAIRRFQTRR